MPAERGAAAAYDLKVFFEVVGRSPKRVRPGDVLGFMTAGYCTRPPEPDCAFESICENCTFFQNSIEFRPTIQAQHDDAANKGQEHRAQLFDQLLSNVNDSEAS